MRSRRVYCACACTRLVLRQCVGGVFVTSRRSDGASDLFHYATKACTTGRTRTAGPSFGGPTAIYPLETGLGYGEAILELGGSSVEHASVYACTQDC